MKKKIQYIWCKISQAAVAAEKKLLKRSTQAATNKIDCIRGVLVSLSNDMTHSC